MTCNLHRFTDNEIKKYTCDDVRRLKNQWYADYQKNNFSSYFIELGIFDERFDHFRNEINEFLDNCKCHLRIDNMIKKYNEDATKTTVGERIHEAKKLREEGKSPWNSKIRPIGSRILVKRTKTEKKKGNLLLLESAQKKENTGTVIAIGLDVSGIALGDKILFDPYTSTLISNDESDDDLLMFNDKDILAVIHE